MIKKRDVTDTGPHWPPWLKNVTSLTRGPNWPPWLKNVTSLTRGPNWPFRCLDDILWWGWWWSWCNITLLFYCGWKLLWFSINSWTILRSSEDRPWDKYDDMNAEKTVQNWLSLWWWWLVFTPYFSLPLILPEPLTCRDTPLVSWDLPATFGLESVNIEFEKNDAFGHHNHS